MRTFSPKHDRGKKKKKGGLMKQTEARIGIQGEERREGGGGERQGGEVARRRRRRPTIQGIEYLPRGC